MLHVRGWRRYWRRAVATLADAPSGFDVDAHSRSAARGCGTGHRAAEERRHPPARGRRRRRGDRRVRAHAALPGCGLVTSQPDAGRLRARRDPRARRSRGRRSPPGFSTNPRVRRARRHRTTKPSRSPASRTVAAVPRACREADESEGYDRDHIDLPAEQLALLDAVLEVNPQRRRRAVATAASVALPFRRSRAGDPRGMAARPGRGPRAADVLFGEVNPSGKLTETIPLTASRTVRATSTSRATRAACATARACSSATAGTTARDLRRRVPVRARPVLHHVRVQQRGRVGNGQRCHRQRADHQRRDCHRP